MSVRVAALETQLAELVEMIGREMNVLSRRIRTVDDAAEDALADVNAEVKDLWHHLGVSTATDDLAGTPLLDWIDAPEMLAERNGE